MIDDIRLLSGLEVEEFDAPAAEILEKIAECYQVTVEKMIENLNPEHGPTGESKNLHDIEVMANEPTVINLVNLIISTALRERASDIHLVPFEATLQLRYRIDGLLQEKPPPPKQLHAALVSRIKIMADMNIAERFMPQDGHIQINHRGVRVDIRVGTMPTIYGESLVMRLLEKELEVADRGGTGAGSGTRRRCCRVWWKSRTDFSSTTGPTGSGKTTTLYSDSPGHLHAGKEDPDDRRSGRIRAARRGADPGAAQPEFHFCQRPALHSAPGPRRGHGGRNPGLGDGGDRHSRGAHRPPGLQHAAHERFHRRRDAAAWTWASKPS